jgi:GT2 family glycosyltransferase
MRADSRGYETLLQREAVRTVIVISGQSEHELVRVKRIAARSDQLIVLCPPECRAAIGPYGDQARWLTDSDGSEAMIGVLPELERSLLVRRALLALSSETAIHEVRCSAANASGWATAIGMRQHGELPGCRLVVELVKGDEELASRCRFGDGVRQRLVRDAARTTLRDADVVEGDEGVRSALAEAGWVLGTPRAKPSWPTNQPPLISAIVAHKDHPSYLPLCLDSIRAQTQSLEIVVIDDGSGEAGLAAVESEAVLDPTMKVIRQDNRGPGAARNRAVKEASGQLLMFVDADNTLRPDCVKRLAEALRWRREAAYAVPGNRQFDSNSGETIAHSLPVEASLSAQCLDNYIGDTCAMHRRDAFLAVGGFDEDRRLAEDWDLWFKYAAAGITGTVVPEVLFDYRISRSSRWQTIREIGPTYMLLRMATKYPHLIAQCAEEAAVLASTERARTVAHLTRLTEEAESKLRSVQNQLSAERAHAEERQEQLERLLEKLGQELNEWKAQASDYEARAINAEREAVNTSAELGAMLRQLELARSELHATRMDRDALKNSAAMRLVRLVEGVSPRVQRQIGKSLRILLDLLERRIARPPRRRNR